MGTAGVTFQIGQFLVLVLFFFSSAPILSDMDSVLPLKYNQRHMGTE